MDIFSTTSRLSCFLILCFFASSYAQNCSTYSFSNGRSYANCNILPVLNSFLHWNYHRDNHTADVAYRHTGVTASNWVAWSLNPITSSMIGTQSLVAFINSRGSLRAYTSPVSSYATTLQEGPLSFPVASISAEFANNEMIIYSSIGLPAGRTNFTQVWQSGVVSGDALQQHSTRGDNVRSIGAVDFATG